LGRYLSPAFGARAYPGAGRSLLAYGQALPDAFAYKMHSKKTLIECLCLGAVLAALLLSASGSAALAQPLEPPRTYRLPPVESDPIENVTPAAPPPETIAPPEGQPGAADEEDYFAGPDWWFMPTAWFKPWEGSAELGLNGTEGNSQTFNVRAGAKAKYEQPWVTQTYEVVHVDNSADGVKTALNGFFDGRIVWPFAESPWSYFIHTRIEYDDFRDYDARVSGDTGLSYAFWKTDASKLEGRSGISTSREIGGTENQFLPEVTFGFDLSHKFDERQKISLTSDYYPSLEDFTGDYRINTTASWEIVVSKTWGLSAKLSVIDRYDNTPQGRRANDLNYAALMLWAF
jgi:hypothetical protein